MERLLHLYRFWEYFTKFTCNLSFFFTRNGYETVKITEKLKIILNIEIFQQFGIWFSASLLIPVTSIHSFRLFIQPIFKSTTTQRRSQHNEDRPTCWSFTRKRYRQLRVRDLPKVHMRRQERNSNPRPFGRKASNIPTSHHASQCKILLPANFRRMPECLNLSLLSPKAQVYIVQPTYCSILRSLVNQHM